MTASNMTTKSTSGRGGIPTSTGGHNKKWVSQPWFWLVVLLGGSLLVLFHQSFESGQIPFVNDVTVGQMKAIPNQLPEAFKGIWRNGAWIGLSGVPVDPTISALLKMIFSPEIFLRLYAPFSLFFIGFSAWLFFRQLRFSALACVLGGVAAGLNGHFFSIACWGEGNWNIAAGCVFLALSAISSKVITQLWAKGVLAGMAVGMCVMEGFDVGAIMAIMVGAFVFFRPFSEETTASQKVVRACVSELVVVLFAAFVASHTVLDLVNTQVKGISSMGQEEVTKSARWKAATQWSLPKLETLQIAAPGVFGYRLEGNIPDQDRSSQYWGLIGQDPRIGAIASDDPSVRQQALASIDVQTNVAAALNSAEDRHSRTPAVQSIVKENGMFWRYSGTGECAGIMVTLVALFALANLWRADSPFSKSERLRAGFWGVTAVFSLVASWGRFAFLYSILYKLPYISTIRNPIKFMNPFHISLVILAAYGFEALYRRYLQTPAKAQEVLPLHLKIWWGKVRGFDRRWTIFALILAGVAVAGYGLLSANKAVLVRYLQDEAINPSRAPGVAEYCLSSALWFLVFFLISIAAICAVLSGAWSGDRIKMAWIVLGVVLLTDLGRADIPWIRYFDYAEKYMADPMINFLADHPYEHRFTSRIEPMGPGSGIGNRFGQLCYFWLQNDFPEDGIQALEFAQMPRVQDLDQTYMKNFWLTGIDIKTVDLWPALRLWQLTDTRYIGNSAGLLSTLMDRFDTNHENFRIVSRFNLGPKPGIHRLADGGDLIVEPAKPGAKWTYALMEYTRALPRAKLYSNWRTISDNKTVLKTLISHDFEPLDSVLISGGDIADSNSKADPGNVTITDYKEKYIRLDADARTAAVLLLNDRTDPDWHVTVDSHPSALLRCNYIMRGVYLPEGHHTVEFKYEPPLTSLYVSLSAIGAGILLSGYLVISHRPVAAPASNPAPEPPPPAPAAPQPVVNTPSAVLPKRKKLKKSK